MVGHARFPESSKSGEAASSCGASSSVCSGGTGSSTRASSATCSDSIISTVPTAGADSSTGSATSSASLSASCGAETSATKSALAVQSAASSMVGSPEGCTSKASATSADSADSAVMAAASATMASLASDGRSPFSAGKLDCFCSSEGCACKGGSFVCGSALLSKPLGSVCCPSERASDTSRGACCSCSSNLARFAGASTPFS
mmetsp:Transcript_48437/g.122222  ORF Transcript_48437/g.122222 Transcript_48437/m.122222 type:complete len:203 (+) Transcript_48437:312-920(+)